jgi:dipeptidyl aminopeptidase/acylaminoacyl peptidase
MPKDGALLSKDRIKGTDVFAISYQSNGHRVNGFLALPKGKGKHPCIIFNRGGANAHFALTEEKAVRWLGGMVAWGYVVIASNYSGAGGSEGEDDLGGKVTLNDVLNLKKVLEQVKEADTSRIGMYGASRGGMMTYLALAKVKWIKAAVASAGLADLKRNARARPKMKKLYGEIHIRTPKDYFDRSAVQWPEKFHKKTPVLLMHGTADWRVPVLDSLDLARGLYESKVPYRLVIFEGADHSISEHRDTRNQMVREWFDRFVKNGEALPNLKLHGE